MSHLNRVVFESLEQRVLMSTSMPNAPLTPVSVSAPETAVVQSLPSLGSTLGFVSSLALSSNTDSSVQLLVARVGSTLGTDSMHYSTVDGTAAAGVDYVATAGTMVFAPGELLKSITIPLLGNAAAPASNSFAVNLANESSGAAIGLLSTATVTLANARSLVQLSSPTMTVSNLLSVANLNVTRSGNTALPALIGYTTTGADAIPGLDFTSVSGLITFLPGQTSQTISIPLLGNAAAAATSGLQVALTNAGDPATVIGGVASTLVNLLNPHSIVANASPAVTVLAGVPSMTFNVVRTGNTAIAASANYATSNGTALSGTDFTNTSGTLNFAAGQTSKTVTVPLSNVSTFADRAFNFVLSSPGVTTILDAVSTVVATIAHTAGTPSLSSFKLFSRSQDRPNGGGLAKALALRSVSYNATTQTLTIIPKARMKTNRFYQLVVNSSQIKDVAGHALDGANSGVSGSAANLYFGSGTKLSYVDHDGDKVLMSMTGAGSMWLNRSSDGEASELKFIGTNASTIVTGAVKKSKKVGTGTTIIPKMTGLGLGHNLFPPAFQIASVA